MDVGSQTPNVVKATEVSSTQGMGAKPSQATASVYSHELWSSKALNLLWLPRADNWHSPCLLNVSSPEVGMIDSHDNRTTNAAQWFWKVDPKFGAWVCRTIKRAEQAKQDINAQIPGVHIAVAIIREYLETVYPGNWKGIQSASEGPVRLDDEILSNAIDFARFELIPKWKGWGKAAECLDLAKGGPAVPSATEQGSAPKLNEAKTSRRADSRSSGQGLFD